MPILGELGGEDLEFPERALRRGAVGTAYGMPRKLLEAQVFTIAWLDD